MVYRNGKERSQRPREQLHEELTTDMHYEFVDDEISYIDFCTLAVYGAINRGFTKEEALKRYNMTEEYYDANIERCLHLDW